MTAVRAGLGADLVRLVGLAGLLSCLAAGAAVAQAPPGEEGGNPLLNIFKYGGTTVPPVAPIPLDDAYCPPVDVPEGGAAMQGYGGGKVGQQGSLRSQITLGQIGRECAPQPDGSVSVKLGIQGRALLGQNGTPGRFEAPVYMVIKRNGAVVASRAKRLAIIVPPGSSQGSATLIEDGLVVPAAAARDYDIEVGLGTGPKAARPAPQRGRSRAAPTE